MVLYVERKRRRPDEKWPQTTTKECRLFECSGEGSKKQVRLIARPPVFNLTVPPNPFKYLNLADGSIDSRDKFLLFYLSDDLMLTSTSGGDEVRDKCSNLRIQLLAGAANDDSPGAKSNTNNFPGATSGYNYIRSKIVLTSNDLGNEQNGSSWQQSSGRLSHNNDTLLMSRSDINSPRVGLGRTVGVSNSSNLFSSFLYSFSILFVLFILFFFIYLYYSRYIVITHLDYNFTFHYFCFSCNQFVSRDRLVNYCKPYL